MNIKIILLASAAVLTAASAHAQELITNGGFETGDLTGWTLGDDQSAFVTSYSPQSGTFCLKLTPGSSTNEALQTLNTTAGQSYDISLWIFHDGGDNTNNTLALDWDGSLIAGSPTVLQAATGWVDYTYSLVASTSSTVLSVTAHDPVGNIYLDNVSVQPSAAPEPASLAALGLGALVLLRRSRRKN